MNIEKLEQEFAILQEKLTDLQKQVEQAKAEPVWPMTVEDLPGDPVYSLVDMGVVQGIFEHTDLNTFPTIEAARSAAAFSQLARLVHHINGGEVYAGDEVKNWHVVEYFDGEIDKATYTSMFCFPACLHFKNKSDRDRSMVDHRDLWIQYFTGE